MFAPFVLHGCGAIDLELVELYEIDAESVDVLHAIDDVAHALVG